MADTSKHRHRRRQFDDDFKAQAVRLVLDEDKSIAAVARDLDLTESALREWVNRARADRTHGRTGLTTAEREELARLRKENRQLRLEREILKNGGLLRDRASDTFALIHARKADFPIATMCQVLGVSTSGYYAWSCRPSSAHAQRDRLKVLVQASFDASKQSVSSATAVPASTRELFDDIEVFYNQRRRHSTLGQISPAAFERRAAA